MKMKWFGMGGIDGNIPCQILLRGTRHRQHGHHRHLFSPFSLTVAKVVGPFCMYGSRIARCARVNDTIVICLAGVVQVLSDEVMIPGAGGAGREKWGKSEVMNPIFFVPLT